MQVMKVNLYDFRGGINATPKDILMSTKKTLEAMKPQIVKNGVHNIRLDMKDRLSKEGWSGSYRLDADSQITITSYQRQTGLCIQTGNVSRIYADLLKLQTLYNKSKIDSAIIIVPLEKTANVLAYNMATYERLSRELTIFDRVITMPIVIFGFGGEAEEGIDVL